MQAKNLEGLETSSLDSEPSDKDTILSDTNIESSEPDTERSDLNIELIESDPTKSDSNNELTESEFVDLISKAEQGGEYTYKLESSLTGTISKSIEIKGSFVLDLYGQTLDVTADKSSLNLFNIGDGAALTIQDSAGNGMIKFSGGDNAASVSDGGTLNIEGGIIITDNRAVFITGSDVKPGNLNMTGGSIKGNNANGNGGGICAVNTSIVNITGGTIENNSSTANGGGIYARNDTVRLTVGGTAKISDNRADGNGGGIYAAANAAVNIEGNAQITKNTDCTGEIKSGSIYGGLLTLGKDCIVSGYQEPDADKDDLTQFIKDKTSVVLDRDYTTKVVHTIAKDTNLVIDLNGHTINAELIDDNGDRKSVV